MFYTHSTQMAKLPVLLAKQGKSLCLSKHETVSLQMKFLITFFNKNQYILIIRHNFSRDSDAILTHKIYTKAFTSLLCRAGALRNNKQSLEELWGIDGDGTRQFRLLMSQRRLKIPIRCIPTFLFHSARLIFSCFPHLYLASYT